MATNTSVFERLELEEETDAPPEDVVHSNACFNETPPMVNMTTLQVYDARHCRTQPPWSRTSQTSGYSSVSGNTEDEDHDPHIEVHDRHNSPTICADCRGHRKACSIASYLLVSIFCACSVVAMVTVSVLLVQPYVHATRFHSAICRAEHSDQKSLELHCWCGKGCTSGYPCLRIHVTVLPLATQHRGRPDASSAASHTTAVLRHDEVSLGRPCSYYPPCKSSRKANEDAVKEYTNHYGKPGRTFPCLYNPKQLGQVIRARRFQLHHVVHGLLWSSLSLITALTLLILTIKKRGCDFL